MCSGISQSCISCDSGNTITVLTFTPPAPSAARLANRVLMVAKKEADNSEDPRFIAEISAASDRLQRGELDSRGLGDGFLWGGVLVG